MDDRALIETLGGPAKVAELLGYDKEGGTQRVHNWTTRGIPPKVKLERPDLFLQGVATPAPPNAAATPAPTERAEPVPQASGAPDRINADNWAPDMRERPSAEPEPARQGYEGKERRGAVTTGAAPKRDWGRRYYDKPSGTRER